MCMSPTRLLAGLCSVHLLSSLVDQIFQLQRLDQIRVPHQSAISHADVLEFLHDLRNNFLALGHILSVSIHRGILLHGNLQLPTQHCSWNGSLGMTHLIHALDARLTSILREAHRWAVGFHQLGSGVCCLASKDDQIQQGVRPKAVCSVDGCAASLSCSQQAGDNLVLSILDDLRLPIGGDATHVVVNGWQHRRWLFRHINSGKDLSSL
mmetsp:Transcript_9810/g.18222  ORF Transcript_9810/g.18222 Transcript_9810/m.18222 type:complete len:209 (-) Transcript_9810:234-860(-)